MADPRDAPGARPFAERLLRPARPAGKRRHLQSFLLRQGRVFTGRGAWTRAHTRWMCELFFERPAQHPVLAECRLAFRAQPVPHAAAAAGVRRGGRTIRGATRKAEVGSKMPERTPEVEVKILDRRIREWGLPRYQSELAAAVDLFACLDAPLVLRPASPAQLVPSGISVFIGDPHLAAVIVPRSGLGHKGLVLGNLVGVLDADYLGPVIVSAWNRNPAGTDPIEIQPGDRIAQMVFVPVVRPTFAVVEEFSRQTLRGVGGFGSTGVAGQKTAADAPTDAETEHPTGEL